MKKLEEIIYGRVFDCYEKNSRWIMFLHSSCGRLICKIWDYDENNNIIKYPQKNQIIKIKIQDHDKKEFQKWKSLTLRKNFEYVEKNDVPEEHIKKLYPNITKKQISKISQDLIDKSNWNDIKNYDFVLGCIKSVGLEKFSMCPAAKNKHHAYKGGLFVHTHEVLQNCLKLYEANENEDIDKDVLMASAWLHDIGKTETYFMDEQECPDCTEQENLVTHSTYSCCIVYNYAIESKFENKLFLDKIMHCLASHHGRKDWNAIVEPRCNEAHILHAADNISSKIHS